MYVNPTGKFVIGGPMGDAGLTGRKIIVDTYGGAAPHGGGAFSGKDPTKVDRSGAYAARYVAKNIVAAGLAERCLIQVAYAIGVARPFSILVDCFDTHRIDPARIESLVHEHFDLRPAAILRDLDLRRPIYAKTAAYGHFGRDDHDFTWERVDKAEALARAAGSTRAGVGLTFRPDEQAGGGLVRDRTLVAVHAYLELACGRGCRRELDRRARDEPLVVEPVQQIAVVLGEPHDRRPLRRARGPRAARARGSPPARRSVSIGQPCGQRSGSPSRTLIRSTMSSLNVSPSSSAWTCASAAV